MTTQNFEEFGVDFSVAMYIRMGLPFTQKFRTIMVKDSVAGGDIHVVIQANDVDNKLRVMLMDS